MKTRKLIILGMAIVACMMASCKKDEVKPTNSIVFKASIESSREAGDDKTAIDTSDTEHPNKGRVVWSEGDKIRIHNGITSGIFTLISGAGQKHGEFGFFDGVYELAEEGGHYLAAYPLTGDINYSENKVVFNMPATQNLGRADSTFANGANPMVAWATSVNEQNFITGLNFKNVCGGIGIRLKGANDGITVSNIRIISNNTSDYLWGNLTVNMNNNGTIGTISISNSNEATNKNVIDLSCDFALSTMKTKRVFIVLPVGTLSQGFRLEVTYKENGGENQILEKATTSNLAAVELNKLKSLKVLTIGTPGPTVTTSGISDITSTSATCGGTVTSIGDAGATVTERGICWSTSHNPTISGIHASNGSGTGGYTVSMTGLTPNTTYYVRAYAINSAGFIGYGNEVSFKTTNVQTYTVSVSANPSNGGTVTGGGTYNQDASCTVTATASEGYTFTNWTEGGSVVSTEANYTFTVTGNRNLVANFATPLTFEAMEAGASVTFTKAPTIAELPIEYSLNGGTWTTYSTPIPLTNVGDKVSFRGNNASYATGASSNKYSYFSFDKDCSVYGNIMSLVDKESFATNTTLTQNFTFCHLFGNFDSSTNQNAPNPHLYNHSSKTLVLPATTLTRGCYFDMFNGCTNLTTAPVLPATTLATSCYEGMFSGCTSLAATPTLSATTLAQSCYDSMFSGCTSLTTAPELAVTDLTNKNSCYRSMFSGCTSLTAAPALPATTIAIECYKNMFKGCTSLTTAPTLPATILYNYCYDGMFSGCTNLTTAPALPATTLTEFCYREMFKNCTNLTTAPTLPATTLTIFCYYEMFNGCSNLNSVTCLATNISATQCTLNWLSGVASSGTFTKAPSMTSWTTGTSGIPSGWTVVDAPAP